MMYLPEIFNNDLFNDVFDFPFYGRNNKVAGEPKFSGLSTGLMKTDIKDVENGYELAIDLPGFKKEDIKVSLDKGYLTVSAENTVNNDEKDENGRYIRRERYMGSCSRSFYVGRDYTVADVKAKYEDGILKLDIPKRDKAVEEKEKYVAIEG